MLWMEFIFFTINIMYACVTSNNNSSFWTTWLDFILGSVVCRHVCTRPPWLLPYQMSPHLPFLFEIHNVVVMSSCCSKGCWCYLWSFFVDTDYIVKCENSFFQCFGWQLTIFNGIVIVSVKVMVVSGEDESTMQEMGRGLFLCFYFQIFKAVNLFIVSNSCYCILRLLFWLYNLIMLIFYLTQIPFDGFKFFLL